MTRRGSIGRLPELVAALPPADGDLFHRLFRLTVSEGRPAAPASMQGWLAEAPPPPPRADDPLDLAEDLAATLERPRWRSEARRGRTSALDTR